MGRYKVPAAILGFLLCLTLKKKNSIEYKKKKKQGLEFDDS